MDACIVEQEPNCDGWDEVVHHAFLAHFVHDVDGCQQHECDGEQHEVDMSAIEECYNEDCSKVVSDGECREEHLERYGNSVAQDGHDAYCKGDIRCCGDSPSARSIGTVIEEDIDDDDEYINAIREEDSFDDLEDLSLDDKPTKKNLLENFMNSMVDRFINGNNANGIMHSFFKMDDKYINDYENPLIESFKEEIINNIKSIPLNQLFEIVEKITRCEGNSRTLFLSKDSLSVIRRTKFKLMIQGYSIIFKNLMEALVKDFDSRIIYDENTNERKIFLNAFEKIKSPEYKLNMDALSEIGEKNVQNNIKEEKEKAINYLMKETKFKDIDRTLVEEFFKTLKIDYVLLFKKVLLNYYKQLEIYKERNEKVVYFIKNKQKFVNANDCYNNKEENKDDYWLSDQKYDKIVII